MAAAGNNASDARNFQPANCDGVIAVSATTRAGPEQAIAIRRDRGDQRTRKWRAVHRRYRHVRAGCRYRRDLQRHKHGDAARYRDCLAHAVGQSVAHGGGGTSQAAELRATLPIGTGSDCSVGVCGAGIADAGAAVLAVSPPAATISASPTSIAPGEDRYRCARTVLPRRVPPTGIGVYAPGASPTAYIEWIYVSCSKTPTTARAAGSCPFALPCSLAPGSYQLRLFANDGYTPLAASAALTVTSSPTAASLSVVPASVAAGGTITANWERHRCGST